MICKSCGTEYKGEFCPHCGEKLIHEVQQMHWRQKNFFALSIRSSLEKMTREAFQRHYQYTPEYKELTDFMDSMHRRLREESLKERANQFGNNEFEDV